MSQTRQPVAQVIPLPTARALPTRTVEFHKAGGSRAVTIVKETFGTSVLWYVVVVRIFTGATTIAGGFANFSDARAIALEEMR
jgi:hypothetical protein